MAQQIITIDGGSGQPKQTLGGPNKGKQYWTVIGTDGNWYSLYYDGPKPQKGQEFNCMVNSREYNGKTYHDAHIITAPPQPFANPAPQLAPKPPQAQPEPQSAPTATPALSNGKIKWDEWLQIADAASQLAHRLEPDRLPLNGDAGLSTATARIAFVNTTLIAFSNGKLELPTEAGPVSTAGAYDDPDEIPF